MLTQNIWVGPGLVNGTTGIVEDVVWKEHADIKKDQPQALLIAVDGYNGPALYTQQDGRKVTPVFSILHEWEGASGSCLRRQFPVTLAFALTMHKSQGLTLNRVVLDIKDKDNTAGLTYVAVSRVKKLLGIMFECGFNQERFQPSTSKAKEARQEDFVRRQQQLLANNFS
jgi:ATP-dependent DNA helicase PIF1